MTEIATDFEVIVGCPPALSQEALLLLRRLRYIKLSVSGASSSNMNALEDCDDFENFIYALFRTKNMTIDEFINKTNPYFKVVYTGDDDES